MRRFRRSSAILALAAMTLSLSEGLLASACADDAGMSGMSPVSHEQHGVPADGEPGTGSDDQRQQSDCPMSMAAVSNCAATAVAARAPLGPLPAPVLAERVAPDSQHVPGSYLALGLFRPPIA